MLAAKAANSASPTEQELLAVSQEMGDILVAGARQAPVVSNFYAQVAAAMVQASASKNPGYPPVLKGVFVRRSILSLQAATTVEAAAPIGCGSRDCPRGGGRPNRRLGHRCAASRALWSRSTTARRVPITSPAVICRLSGGRCEFGGPCKLDHGRPRLCR